MVTVYQDMVSPLINAKLMKEDKRNIDEFVFTVPLGTTVNVGDSIEYKDVNGVKIFAGLLQNVKTSGVLECSVFDNGVQLQNRTVNYIFTSMSPEAIISYVITNYTTLTYVSTISSGITIANYVCNKKRAWDIVTELSDILQANFYVDKNNNFRLEIEGNVSSTKSIDSNTCTLDGSWTTDQTAMINSVTVDADDRQVFTKFVTFSGTGAQTVFTLAEIPDSTLVEYPVGTLKTGYVPNSSTGDYYVTRDSKTITFAVAPASGTNNIKVTYTYTIPISVRRRDAASIALYGQHDKTMKVPYIKSRSEAQDYAQYIMNLYSSPLQTSTWIINSSFDYNDMDNWKPNELINVNDRIRNISGNYVIRKIVREFPGLMRVTVGSRQADMFFWLKETERRIKQLEEQSNNATIITEDEYITDSVTVELTESINYRARFLPDDALVFGDNNDSPVYANIGAGTARPWRDATGGAQPYFYLADATVWSQEIVVYPVELLLAENGDFLTTETGEFFYRQ